MLVKSSNELFGPLDPLLAGGELFLHSLDLPWVDNLLTYTHTKRKLTVLIITAGFQCLQTKPKKEEEEECVLKTMLLLVDIEVIQFVHD